MCAQVNVANLFLPFSAQLHLFHLPSFFPLSMSFAFLASAHLGSSVDVHRILFFSFLAFCSPFCTPAQNPLSLGKDDAERAVWAVDAVFLIHSE